MLIVRMLVLFAASITWMSAGLVYGQDRIRFTINLHGMDKEKLVVHFDDGVVLNVLDLSQTDSVLLVDQPIYTPYPALFAIYDGKSSDKYLIEKDGAVLNLFYDASRSKTPVYSNNNTRVRAIDDTVSNSLYRDLRRLLRDDLHQLNNLFTKHGAEIRTNDSVRHALDQACRSANAKSMTFLAKHPNDFFSFYYFKDQVLGLTDFFVGDDPEYAAEQLAYYRETFPEAFRSTGQGKQIDAGLVRKISPVVLKEQAMMPEVKFNTIDGHSIALKNQKERFILLDFWASWCTPCIQQLPDLKALRDEFSADSLKIVSISIDRDSSKFVEGMKLHDMNWTHGLDRGGVEQ